MTMIYYNDIRYKLQIIIICWYIFVSTVPGRRVSSYIRIAIECVRCSRTVMVFCRVSEMLHDDDCTSVYGIAAGEITLMRRWRRRRRHTEFIRSPGGFFFFNENRMRPYTLCFPLPLHHSVLLKLYLFVSLSFTLTLSLSLLHASERPFFYAVAERVRRVSIIHVRPQPPISNFQQRRQIFTTLLRLLPLFSAPVCIYIL